VRVIQNLSPIAKSFIDLFFSIVLSKVVGILVKCKSFFFWHSLTYFKVWRLNKLYWRNMISYILLRYSFSPKLYTNSLFTAFTTRFFNNFPGTFIKWQTLSNTFIFTIFSKSQHSFSWFQSLFVSFYSLSLLFSLDAACLGPENASFNSIRLI
jgi:hypothetical protein